jgi:hypothetical protein
LGNWEFTPDGALLLATRAVSLHIITPTSLEFADWSNEGQHLKGSDL